MAETKTQDELCPTRDGTDARPGEIVERVDLVPNVCLMKVRAPAVARKMKPGQFLIVRAWEDGERVPLSVSDWDAEEGTVSFAFLQVGTSTYRLGERQAGERLPTIVGPLGRPLDLEFEGTALLAGGCYGIGAIYPVARELKRRGHRVLIAIEARSAFLLWWMDRLEQVSDRLLIGTRDGSRGARGSCPSIIRDLLAAGEEPIARVHAVGCTMMMHETAEATRPAGIRTTVSLNPIMIDGTGMCGACRVAVGGETKFACVDGPDFDGHAVDWSLLFARRKPYLALETESAQR